MCNLYYTKTIGNNEINILKRKITNEVKVGNIRIGGGNPIVIQSMTNTDTSDIDAKNARFA